MNINMDIRRDVNNDAVTPYYQFENNIVLCIHRIVMSISNIDWNAFDFEIRLIQNVVHADV